MTERLKLVAFWKRLEHGYHKTANQHFHIVRKYQIIENNTQCFAFLPDHVIIKVTEIICKKIPSKKCFKFDMSLK